MADDEDQSSKTEEPTDRKLRKLREDGNVPRSKEVSNFAMLVAMLVVIGLAIPWQMEQLLSLFGTTFQAAGTTDVQARNMVGPVMEDILFKGITAIAPVFVILMVFAYLGGISQTGPILSFKPIQPKLEKISLIKGMKRLFSMKSLAEFLKSVFKLAVIGGAMWAVFYVHDEELLILADFPLMGILETTHALAIKLILAALAIMFVIAVVDFLFQRAQYTKEHRMSRKDLKDEIKDTEGDPYVKQRQRQLQQQRARQRMMQDVPNADVVITNPTHYSVAVSYKPDEGMAAQKVVAKGTDVLAFRIREIAEKHDIPLYEDPPLARQLYADAEIGEEIPLSLYEVTAKVIAYITQLKKRYKA
ncbi:MAG: flagellar biosynthesis protein FlhB [Alphaproteobacteria bacterium]|nr:flagellar biosynthesis protein FlhB [Alphaproteobacteria bacterium]